VSYSILVAVPLRQNDFIMIIKANMIGLMICWSLLEKLF